MIECSIDNVTFSQKCMRFFEQNKIFLCNRGRTYPKLWLRCQQLAAHIMCWGQSWSWWHGWRERSVVMFERFLEVVCGILYRKQSKPKWKRRQRRQTMMGMRQRLPSSETTAGSCKSPTTKRDATWGQERVVTQNNTRVLSTIAHTTEPNTKPINQHDFSTW